jgi:CTP synthase
VLVRDRRHGRRHRGLPFLEAIRQLGNDLRRGHGVFVHLTLLPYIPSAGELKTKPTQHSVKELRSIGIQPDMLLCRSDRRSRWRRAAQDRAVLQCAREQRDPGARRRRPSMIVPVGLSRRGLDTGGACRLRHRAAPKPNLSSAAGLNVTSGCENPEGEVTIAVVGKYTGLKDAYKSLIEALTHGGIANRVRVKLDWIDSVIFEKEDPSALLEHVHGILVPGGFGERGSEGKIARPASPASAGCPISASASACRWRSSRPLDRWSASPTPTRPSSARRRTRWSA